MFFRDPIRDNDIFFNIIIIYRPHNLGNSPSSPDSQGDTSSPSPNNDTENIPQNNNSHLANPNQR